MTVQSLSKYQAVIALACIAALALDLALPGVSLPSSVSHALIAIAAALGVSRPSEAAAQLAAARGLSVALGIAAVVASDAARESEAEGPAPAEDDAEPGEESGSSSGGSSSSDG